MTRALLLYSILVAPYPLAWWARSRALRSHAAGAPYAWFGFGQTLQWIAFAYVGVMITVFGSMSFPFLQAWLREYDLIEWSTPASILSVGAPLVAFQVWVAALVQDVNRALRGAETSGTEVLSENLTSLVKFGVVILALCTAIALLTRGQVQLGIGTALAGILVGGTLQLRPSRWPRFVPHAVTHGELRDRMFALAGSAGVRLKQLYVVPLTRTRLANALAVQGEKVVVTDYLLANLSRDELDAVLAHELAHLRLGHPLWLAVALIGGAALMWTAYGWSGQPGAAFAGFGVMIFGFMALSRRFEYAADAGAIRLGARPDALVSGLARVHRLNHMPQRWSRWRELTLTHPSNERRAQAIAARCGLASERLQSLLGDTGAPPDRYDLPVVGYEGRVFSTTFKAATLQRNGWLLLFANAVAAAAFASLASGLGLRGWLRVFGFVPLAGLVFAATLALLQHLSLSPYRGLRAKIRQRLEASGIGPDEGAMWIGLAPNADGRLYEGFATWDVGFLWRAGDHIAYAGEETSFSLARDEITGVELGPRFPSWLHVFGVVARWRRHDGLEGSFTLFPVYSRGLIAYAGESRKLRERLERWRRGEPAASDAAMATHPGPVPLSPPPTVQVTSIAPHEALGNGAVLITLVIQFAVSGGVAVVMGLGAAPRRGLGVLDVLLASALAYLFLILPYVRVRKPARSVASPEAQRAA